MKLTNEFRAMDLAHLADQLAFLKANAHKVICVNIQTTDLYGTVLEVAVTDYNGDLLYNSKVRTGNISPKATELHGITIDDVESAPSFEEVWQELITRFSQKIWVIYNADWFWQIIRNSLRQANIDTEINIYYVNAIELYSVSKGDWNEITNNYWFPKFPCTTYNASLDARGLSWLINVITSKHPKGTFKRNNVAHKMTFKNQAKVYEPGGF